MPIDSIAGMTQYPHNKHITSGNRVLKTAATHRQDIDAPDAAAAE
jgi:hypothetical protein